MSRHPTFLRVVGLVVCLLGGALRAGMAAATPPEPPRVGLYFDEVGNACNATLEPFSRVQAHILAFVEPGTELAGALIRLEMPLGVVIEAGTLAFPKNSDPAGSLTGTAGLDLQFQICPVAPASGTVLLASFMLNDLSTGSTRPDLEIRVRGGTIADEDTLELTVPNLKLCDPEQPEGYAELIEAPTTTATLNCTTGACSCEETAVLRRTWTAVRKLYADD